MSSISSALALETSKLLSYYLKANQHYAAKTWMVANLTTQNVVLGFVNWLKNILFAENTALILIPAWQR